MNAIASEMQRFETVWPQCVARAWMDSQFRETLKKDPLKTLREVFQFVFPTGVDLEVVEGSEVMGAQRANTLRMTIPPMPEMDMQEIALVGADCGPGNGNGPPRFCFTLSATAC